MTIKDAAFEPGGPALKLKKICQSYSFHVTGVVTATYNHNCTEVIKFVRT